MAVAGALVLGACAEAPGFLQTRSSGEGARGSLSSRAGEGAVLAVVQGNPFDIDEARLRGLVAGAMAEGVTGARVRFTTDPARAAAPEPHLVVVLNPALEPPTSVACRAPETIATGPLRDQLHVFAAFCDGARALGATSQAGAVSGPSDPRFERLLWRTSATLFPDDYWESYGFDILPKGLDFGVGVDTGR